MPRGILTLKQQLQGVQQKAWNDTSSTYAASFNGSNQYLTSSVNANLALGTSSFTVEYWIYLYATNSGKGIVTFGAPTTSYDAFFGITSVDSGQPNIQWYLSSNGTSWDIVSGYAATPMRGSISINAWNHIAFVRNVNSFSMYTNGQLVNSVVSTASIFQTANTVVLGLAQTSNYFPGLISNFRFVKGTAVYTANFRPPTGLLTAVSGTQLLTLQNSTFIDNSSNGLTFTNTGSIQAQQAYPFTQLSTPAVDYLVVAGGGGGGNNSGGAGGGGGLLQGSIPITTGTSYTVTVGTGGPGGTSTNGTIGVNSVFGNIVATGGGYGGGNNTAGGSGGTGGGGGAAPAGSAGATTIGGQGITGQGNTGGNGLGGGSGGQAGGGGGAGTQGLNAPVTNVAGNGGAGIASAISGTLTVYAGGGGGGTYPNTSTPGIGGVGGGGPGASVASAAGTAGSTNTGGGGGGGAGGSGNGGAGGSGIVIVSYPDVYASAAATTGSPMVSTSGSGSIAFSGTSQYITTVAASALAFSTSNFTVEGFVYFNSIGAAGSPKGVLQLSAASTGINASTANSISLGSNATGKWEIYAAGASIVAASAAPVANTWYHFAIVKNSGTTVLYINGASVISVADTTTYTATYLAVGAYYDAGYGIPGYVSNLRVVNGVAVYTGAFTPPASPLTRTQSAGTNISAITGTSTALLLNTVSGSQFADSSVNSYTLTRTGTPTWNQASPFATGLGYKNRVYTYTSSGTITF